jgi:hypothetical protein
MNSLLLKIRDTAWRGELQVEALIIPFLIIERVLVVSCIRVVALQRVTDFLVRPWKLCLKQLRYVGLQSNGSLESKVGIVDSIGIDSVPFNFSKLLIKSTSLSQKIFHS